MAGVFKSLDQSDVRITPFRTYKLWDQSVGYTTYTAPASSANQTQVLFSKVFGVGQIESRSAIYALSDYNTVDLGNYGENIASEVTTSLNTNRIYKFEYQSDGTYNYVTDLDQTLGSKILENIAYPEHVITSTQTSQSAIFAYDSGEKKVYGLKGDLTNAFTAVTIPSSSLSGQTVNAMDFANRGSGAGNIFLATKYGLHVIPVNLSTLVLTAGSPYYFEIDVAPYSGSYIGVLGSRSGSMTSTHGLQIDENDPLFPTLSPGHLRYLLYEGYVSNNGGSSLRTSSIIEPSTRYTSGPGQTKAMEAHSGCVYALMNDDRLYIIATGSATIAPVSTYMDGVAAVVATRSANKGMDFDGTPLPPHRVHIVTRDGFVILNPLPTRVGSSVIINQSDIIDCRQYLGVDKTIKTVTNLRNTTNENIHVVAGNDNSTGETVSFVVNPNTREISNVISFGSLKASQLATHGGERDFVFAAKKSLTGNLYYSGFTIMYTSSLQGANTTKWYKFDMQ